jgi:hypothetical protein
VNLSKIGITLLELHTLEDRKSFHHFTGLCQLKKYSPGILNLFDSMTVKKVTPLSDDFCNLRSYL